MKKFISGLLIGLTISMGIVYASESYTAYKATFPVFVNGTILKSDKPIVTIEGSTYLPLKLVSEVLGVKIEWNNIEKRVEIGEKPKNKTYKVIKVVDGDTIKIIYNGKEESIRLIGIDTPESVHPDAEKNTELGKVASEYTKSQLEGKEITLELDIQERDKYGRILAYAYINDEMFNKILLKEGYAQLMTISPNVKYADEFVALQKQARESQKGIWFNIQPIKTTGKFVGSTKSSKYHNPNCRWAKEIVKENEIWFNTIEEAKISRYEACGVCNPK